MACRPKLLQICNVGRIGGTAACAWTVTRALPTCQHHVIFLSPPDRETVAAFQPATVSFAATITPRDVNRFQPDRIVLHNTPAARVVCELPAASLLYLHSAISDPAPADAAVCCSQWLARRLGMTVENVLWQAVPGNAPLRSRRVAANRGGLTLTVGRFCTPQARKWPRTTISFYAELARRCPHVSWEFVGCPVEQQAEYRAACGGRATFHPAGWQQRALLSRWDALLYSQPSLPESFGRTAAESMRTGCVPVVDRLGGFVEQIPIECGFLCSSRDEFASALHQLADVRFRLAMSECAQRWANDRFSLPRFGANLLWWFDRAQEAFGRRRAAVRDPGDHPAGHP